MPTPEHSFIVFAQHLSHERFYEQRRISAEHHQADPLAQCEHYPLEFQAQPSDRLRWAFVQLLWPRLFGTAMQGWPVRVQIVRHCRLTNYDHEKRIVTASEGLQVFRLTCPDGIMQVDLPPGQLSGVTGVAAPARFVDEDTLEKLWTRAACDAAETGGDDAAANK